MFGLGVEHRRSVVLAPFPFLRFRPMTKETIDENWKHGGVFGLCLQVLTRSLVPGPMVTLPTLQLAFDE